LKDLNKLSKLPEMERYFKTFSCEGNMTRKGLQSKERRRMGSKREKDGFRSFQERGFDNVHSTSGTSYAAEVERLQDKC